MSLKSAQVCLYAVVAIVCSECSRPVDVPVLLRYSPSVGDTFKYKVKRSSEETRSVLRRIESVSGTEFVEQLEDPLGGTKSIHVNDRLVSEHVLFADLSLPDAPVSVGGKWEGEVRLQVWNEFSDQPVKIEVTHELRAIYDQGSRRYCKILTKPIHTTGRASLPFVVGQVGVRCDLDGKVIEVSDGYGAAGRVHIGDRLVAINGETAETPSDRNRLAQKHIESIRSSKLVYLGLERNGENVEVEIKKTNLSAGILSIGYSGFGFHIWSVIDVHSGVLQSQDGTVDLSIIFPVQELLSRLVDEISGVDRVEKFAGMSEYKRKASLHWFAELEETIYASM